MFLIGWVIAKCLHFYSVSVLLKFTMYTKIKLGVKELYRSGNFIVIDKDFDVKINSDDPSHVVTVETQLKAVYPELVDSSLGHSFRFVHRLDHATSGVLCVALTQGAARLASKMFQDRRVTKDYLALVRGHVRGWHENTLSVDVAIGRDMTETSIYRYCTSKDSHCSQPRRATTRLVVLEYGEYEGQPVTKILLIPLTGRSHQLRVHCAHVGHVIVGDYIYSNRMDNTPYRMMLHAYRLIIPMKDECLDICSEDPFLPETDANWQPIQVVQTYQEYLCQS